MREITEEVMRQIVERERQIIRERLPIPPPPQLPTIHYTELTAAPPDSPIATEWNFYRRQAGQLLAAGHEGKWALIQGEQILGVWETFEEANEVHRSLTSPALLKQIHTYEPVIRIGYNRLCRS
jgi:hypothetical protein